KASAFLRSTRNATQSFRAITQLIRADAYRGKRLRLLGYAKTCDVADWSGLWMRIDGPGESFLAFDNMQTRPIMGTTDWKPYAVVLDVPQEALAVAFGAVLSGAGQVWADDLSLEVVDPKQVQSTDPDSKSPRGAVKLDFETPRAGADADSVPGWQTSRPRS